MSSTSALAFELRAILDEEEAPQSGTPAEPEVMRALGEMDESIMSAQRELAAHHKKLVALRKTSKRGEDLLAVQVIVKEAHSILGELRATVKAEFGMKA